MVSSLLIGLLMLTPQLEWLERAVLNGLFELRGIRQPEAPIVIVAIQRETLDHVGEVWTP
jgi:CHASE2 domain-containing sensor protein